MRWRLLLILVVGAPGLLFSSAWGAEPLQWNAQPQTIAVYNGKEVILRRLGVTLSLPGDYDWWYGCAPTSAGMMLGHYDVHGYAGTPYSNLVPGGNAENQTFSGTTGWSALVNSVIASTGHVADFYKTPPGYGGFGDDNSPPTHTFDCLADFMGTSQDSVGNFNGSTSFFDYPDGSRLYVRDVYSWGQPSINTSGMFGVFEYLQYAGYFTAEQPRFSKKLYNQQIAGYQGTAQGFTWNDYKTEIDAGRPVMIRVYDSSQNMGHAMVGVGYQESGGQQIIELCDTWTIGHGQGSPHTLTWGGTYSGGGYNLQHYAVTVLDLGAAAQGIAVTNQAGAWDYQATNSPDNTLLVTKFATDMGPFDMEILVVGGLDPINILEEVLNLVQPPVAWTDYHVQLGFGVGQAFTPSTPGDGLFFTFGKSNTFPLMTPIGTEWDELSFAGGLTPPFSTADFDLWVDLPDGQDPFTFTLRQWPTVGAVIPEPATLVLVLVGAGALALFRRLHGGVRRRAR